MHLGDSLNKPRCQEAPAEVEKQDAPESSAIQDPFQRSVYIYIYTYLFIGIYIYTYNIFGRIKAVFATFIPFLEGAGSFSELGCAF